MERIKKCRICMDNVIPLRSIVNTHLQQMFELLSLTPLETNDSRPTLFCYICCARLQNCYQLKNSCIQSEHVFTQILNNNVFTPAEMESLCKNNFTIAHPVVYLSLGDEVESSDSDDSETSEMFNKTTVKEENGQEKEDIDSDENNIDPSTQYTITNDLLDIVKNELDDGSTKKEDIDSDENNIDPSTQYTITNDLLDIVKNELDDGSTKEEDIDSDENNIDPSTQYTNTNDLLDIVKNELDDGSTSTPVPKKPRVAPQRNLEDTTRSLETKINNSTDKIEQPKNYTEIALRQKPIAESESIMPTNEKIENDKSTFSVSTSTADHNNIQIAKSISNICLGASFSNTSRESLKARRCDICQKCFINNYLLKTHMRVHTGEKPFKCKLCEKCYRVKSSLTSHIRTHTGDKPFRCKLCVQCFSAKSRLSEHIRTHTGEKPFKCKLCEKCFGHLGSLNNHIRTHNVEKPFKCKLCEKGFCLMSSLNKHIRTHTAEKPFKCKLCEKGFCLKNSLNIHIRTHTGEKPFKCKLCEKCFNRKDYLNKHIRTHAGQKVQ